MENSFERLKSLDLSRDEVDRLGEALKKDEFRKLLLQYVDEIQDPENKKLYEKEIIQLEKERGVDATFLHPEPGYVIKTSVNGSKKGFINICANELVKKPTSTPSEKDGARGLQWALPHSLSPPSEDVDNKGVRCQVFDVVFHPDTLHLAHKNKAFRTMVNNTACSAIESSFDVKLDTKNLKFPKIKYKGCAHPSLIRKPSGEAPIEHQSPEEKEFFDKLYAQADDRTQQYKTPKKSKKNERKISEDNSLYTTPKYSIKHRSHVELEDFTEHRGAKLNAAIPKELIVEINLPLLKSSNDIILDVTEKTVQLLSEKPAKYKLNLTLPYQVNQDNGNAKFDKDLKKLLITLPVKRNVSLIITDFNREDSGVDSDHGSPLCLEFEEQLSDKNLITQLEPCELTKVESSTEFRTSSFLDESVHYVIPEFNCHVFDNIIAFTLNVKNVDENTVLKIIDDVSKSIHVKFISVSPSFFHVHYAFYVQLPCESIDTDSVSIETWDNNVIVQIPFNTTDNELQWYMYGVSDQECTKKYLEEPCILNTILEESTLEDITKSTTGSIALESSVGEEVDCDNQTKEEIPNLQTEAINIASSYESSGDELSCSFSPSKSSRGILKRLSANRKAVVRSVSESSLDDYVSSSYEAYGTSLDSAIPEDTGTLSEPSTSLKKTVRFNDVVSRQLYRFNSSILGQKKKNQRKAKNKKRASERRLSESETSEADDRKEGETKILLSDTRVAPNNEENEYEELCVEEDNDIFDFQM